MTIFGEIQHLHAELDNLVIDYTDFDGSRKTTYLDGADEAEQRLSLLNELSQLSKPLRDTEWALAMRFGDCPCGLTNAEWEAY